MLHGVSKLGDHAKVDSKSRIMSSKQRDINTAPLKDTERPILKIPCSFLSVPSLFFNQLSLS
jgi:hypothetical protein